MLDEHRDGSVRLRSGYLSIYHFLLDLYCYQSGLQGFPHRTALMVREKQQQPPSELNLYFEVSLFRGYILWHCCHSPYLPLLGFIHWVSTPPSLELSNCPLPKRRNALSSSCCYTACMFRPHAFSTSRRLTPVANLRFIAP